MSVFLPSGSNSAKFDDVFSASSTVPSWTKANSNQLATKTTNEVRDLLNQSGGKRRKHSSKSRKLKRGSSKKSQKNEKMPSKKSSKRSSKNKKMKGGSDKPKRKPPQAFMDMQKVAKAINEKVGLKMGAPMFQVATSFLKENNKDVSKALKSIDSEASKLKKAYEKAEKEQKAKREAKKAAKANASE